jgi:hypothetical protein
VGLVALALSLYASSALADFEPATSASPEPATSAPPEPATSAPPEPATSASPEPATSASPEPATSASPEPAAPDVPAEQRPPLRIGPVSPAPEDPEARHIEHPPNQLALTVGIPYFDDSILTGDLSVDVRYGHKFWWVVPSIGGGFRQARFDRELVPAEARTKKLFAWQVSLGLRVELPVSDKLFPFIGVSAELSQWAFSANTESYCKDDFYPDSMRCYEAMDYQGGRAIKPILGLVYQPLSDLGLEIWVERINVVSHGMFTRALTLYNPSLGVAWHF